MTKKRVVLGITVFLIVALGFNFALQRKQADVPPGVLPEMWIPINENAGVALNMWGESTSVKGGAASTHGTLMIKSQGAWQKIYLEQAPVNKFMPLK